jgi:hypothetical protein
MIKNLGQQTCMKLNQKHHLTGILLGLVIVFFGYGSIASMLKWRRDEQAFLQLNHPPGTVLFHKISMEFSYYPATYIDDSIPFKSAHLVGDLRSYDGSWDQLRGFYGNQTLEGRKTIAVIPLEVHKQGEKIWLETPDTYVDNPGEYDIISAIQEQDELWGSSKSTDNVSQSLYLVYCLWQ